MLNFFVAKNIVRFVQSWFLTHYRIVKVVDMSTPQYCHSDREQSHYLLTPDGGRRTVLSVIDRSEPNGGFFLSVGGRKHDH